LEGSNSFPHWDSNSDRLAVKPVASRYADCTVPARNLKKYDANLCMRDFFAFYENLLYKVADFMKINLTMIPSGKHESQVYVYRAFDKLSLR
jgi:hypothetical protein